MAEGRSLMPSKSQEAQDAPMTRSSSPPSSLSLKRPASRSFEGSTSRKRLKGTEDETEAEEGGSSMMDSRLADDLAQELECGCCSSLTYKPVVVLPCQHFFCGSCCELWIRNGGTNCPVCRAVSTIVTPSRPLQLVLDALLRSAPHKARAERERAQADEVYSGGNLRIPTPREASPEPNVNISAEYIRPCPHCSPNNPYGWTCPQPIPDPATDLEHAWLLEDGAPTGHSQCGNCETFLALRAPSTTKCDFCQVSFCGVGVPGRCVAAPLLAQQPHGMNDIGDLIQSSDVYEIFNSNAVEVDYLLDYITTQNLTPRHIYREVIGHLLAQPRQFRPLIEADIFVDVHPDVTAGTDPDPTAPRSKICRHCSYEILMWGLKQWWIRERQKGFLEDIITSRKDCPDGNDCRLQRDYAHAKELNHIFAPTTVAEGSSNASSSAISGDDPAVGLLDAAGRADPVDSRMLEPE